MPNRSQWPPAGFTRCSDADLTGIASSKCDYCGESFVGSLAIIEQFEEQHRPRCAPPKAGEPSDGAGKNWLNKSATRKGL